MMSKTDVRVYNPNTGRLKTVQVDKETKKKLERKKTLANVAGIGAAVLGAAAGSQVGSRLGTSMIGKSLGGFSGAVTGATLAAMGTKALRNMYTYPERKKISKEIERQIV